MKHNGHKGSTLKQFLREHEVAIFFYVGSIEIVTLIFDNLFDIAN